MTLKMKDMDLFERTCSMYVLLAIDAHPGLTMRDIMRLEDTRERTKYVRMAEMIEAGLVCRARSEATASGLFLTPAGKRIVEHVKAIRREWMRVQKQSSGTLEEGAE